MSAAGRNVHTGRARDMAIDGTLESRAVYFMFVDLVMYAATALLASFPALVLTFALVLADLVQGAIRELTGNVEAF